MNNTQYLAVEGIVRPSILQATRTEDDTFVTFTSVEQGVGYGYVNLDTYREQEAAGFIFILEVSEPGPTGMVRIEWMVL